MKIHQWLMMHHERIISHQAALTKTWLGMFKQSIYIYISILCFTRTLDGKKKIVVSTFNVSNFPCFFTAPKPPKVTFTASTSLHVTENGLVADCTVSPHVALMHGAAGQKEGEVWQRDNESLISKFILYVFPGNWLFGNLTYICWTWFPDLFFVPLNTFSAIPVLQQVWQTPRPIPGCPRRLFPRRLPRQPGRSWGIPRRGRTHGFFAVAFGWEMPYLKPCVWLVPKLGEGGWWNHGLSI